MSRGARAKAPREQAPPQSPGQGGRDQFSIPREYQETFAQIDSVQAAFAAEGKKIQAAGRSDPAAREKAFADLTAKYKPRMQEIIKRSSDPEKVRALAKERTRHRMKEILGRIQQAKANGGKGMPQITVNGQTRSPGGAHMLPDTAPDRLAKIARQPKEGFAQDKNGVAGAPTPAGGVYVTPAWQKARESYQPGDKIGIGGIPENKTTMAMYKRGEIDP